MLNSRVKKYSHGFTIVELLIVIVVIAILAAISVVAYNGIQNRAQNTAVQSDIKQVQKVIEAYNAQHGSYPNTSNAVYVDANCQLTSINRRSDWVPGLTVTTSQLPQSSGLTGTGVGGAGGCYMYASDGSLYLLSAWNAKRGGSSADAMYRRQGFREASWSSSNAYFCNHSNIGGNTGGVYTAAADYYKHSYTVTNITSCNETPPVGA